MKKCIDIRKIFELKYNNLKLHCYLFEEYCSKVLIFIDSSYNNFTKGFIHNVSMACLAGSYV